jgi:hypothetical protein
MLVLLRVSSTACAYSVLSCFFVLLCVALVAVAIVLYRRPSAGTAYCCVCVLCMSCYCIVMASDHCCPPCTRVFLRYVCHLSPVRCTLCVVRRGTVVPCVSLHVIVVCQLYPMVLVPCISPSACACTLFTRLCFVCSFSFYPLCCFACVVRPCATRTACVLLVAHTLVCVCIF